MISCHSGCLLDMYRPPGVIKTRQLLKLGTVAPGCQSRHPIKLDIGDLNNTACFAMSYPINSGICNEPLASHC